MKRRVLLRALPVYSLSGLALPLLAASPSVRSGHSPLAALRDSGGVLLMRHAATEPGLGDPKGFRLGDCGTQRNLSNEGRVRSREAGDMLRQAGIQFDLVVSSAWCRCIDTATLMCPDQEVVVLPALNSFFGGAGDRDAQTGALRTWLNGLPAGQTVLAVTHQVNVQALTGISPAMGEAVVLTSGGGGAQRYDRVTP